MSLSFVSREDWGAVPPKKWNHTTLPITKVYHIATNTKECLDEPHCIQRCQYMQLSHMKRNKGDIRYSFIVGGDGQVYEGRGWKHAPCLPKEYMNAMQRSSILIAFVGRWTSERMPPIMIRAAGDLIDYGVEKKFLSRNYKSKDLFVDEFKERVVAEYIKEAQFNRDMKAFRDYKMVKDMGLKNELASEISDAELDRE